MTLEPTGCANRRRIRGSLIFDVLLENRLTNPMKILRTIARFAAFYRRFTAINRFFACTRPFQALIRLSASGGIGRVLWAGFCGCFLLMAATAWGKPQVIIPNVTGITGLNPFGKLTVGSDGTIYGVTQGDGMYGGGTVFKLSPVSGGYQYHLLHNFGSPTLNWTVNGSVDGMDPLGGMLLIGNILYGTTQAGGTYHLGTLFAVSINDKDGSDPPGYYYVLHAFGGLGDGANPNPTLLEDPLYPYLLYGTTEHGGDSSGDGTVFVIIAWTLPASQGYAILHTFLGGQGNGMLPNGEIDGSNPNDGLGLYSATLNVRWLFGTTANGGNTLDDGPCGNSPGYGTLFTVSTLGDNNGQSAENYFVLWTFTGGMQYNDGASPDTPIAGYVNPANTGTAVLLGMTSFEYPLTDQNPGGPMVFSIPVFVQTTLPTAVPALDNFFMNSCGNGELPAVPYCGGPVPQASPPGFTFVTVPSNPTSSGYATPAILMTTDPFDVILMTSDLANFNILLGPPDLVNLPNVISGGMSRGPNNTYYGNASGVFDFALPGDLGIAMNPEQITYHDPPFLALQTATNLNGPWIDIPGANTTYPFSTTAPQQFFRLSLSGANISASAPAVSTLPAFGLGNSGANLYGCVIPNEANSTAWFQYGPTTNYGSVTATTFVSATNYLYTSNSISGLAAGTKYHYRLVATNSAGTGTGKDLTFTTIPIGAGAPAAATLAATSVTSTNAVFNGMAASDGVDTTAWWQYGGTTNYGLNTSTFFINAAGGSTVVSNVVGKLLPGTVYHFRLMAVNGAGSSAGHDMTFSTSTAVPTVETAPVTLVDARDFILNGYMVPNGPDATAWFQWGTTTNYGNMTPMTVINGSALQMITNLLNGLTAGVTYHYRIVGSNDVGTVTGADLTFTAAPTAITLPASSIGPSEATLNGYVIPSSGDSTAWFQWGTTTNYGNLTPMTFISTNNSLFQSNSIFTGPTNLFVADVIEGLTAGATYHYRIVATNSAGTAFGDDVTFITGESSCLTPPSSLVNWWPADGNANDIIGGDNGILEGGVTYSNGEVGEAFSFDGTNGYVATSLVVTNPQTFSLTLWFQTTTTNGGVLISFDSDQYIQSGDSYDRNIYMDDTGALHFGVWNSGAQQINSGPGYNDGNWHYVAGSLSGSTGLSLYIDGVLIGNNPAVTNADETYNGYWRIGQDNLDNWPPQYQPNSYYFQGQIDEVAIFDTALTATNVSAIYGAGNSGMCQP
jgi:hypothetical protein